MRIHEILVVIITALLVGVSVDGKRGPLFRHSQPSYNQPEPCHVKPSDSSSGADGDGTLGVGQVMVWPDPKKVEINDWWDLSYWWTIFFDYEIANNGSDTVRNMTAPPVLWKLDGVSSRGGSSVGGSWGDGWRKPLTIVASVAVFLSVEVNLALMSNQFQ